MELIAFFEEKPQTQCLNTQSIISRVNHKSKNYQSVRLSKKTHCKNNQKAVFTNIKK